MTVNKFDVDFFLFQKSNNGNSVALIQSNSINKLEEYLILAMTFIETNLINRHQICRALTMPR